MAQVHEMIYMKMTNGEYVYGTNKAIGLYSVENNCECEYEFDHVPAMKLSGQGGYSEGSTAFKYLGREKQFNEDGTTEIIVKHDPMSVSQPMSQEVLYKDVNGETKVHKTHGWDYNTGKFITVEKWEMELIGIFILVIPFVIGYLVGKQAGIKEAQNNDRVD